jgi:hypothetical protein
LPDIYNQKDRPGSFRTRLVQSFKLKAVTSGFAVSYNTGKMPLHEVVRNGEVKKVLQAVL